MPYRDKEKHRQWVRDRRNNGYRERENELRRLRYKKNPEKAKANLAAYYQRIRQKVYEKLGGKCQHCGISDRRVLQVDHVAGGGNIERAKVRNYYAVMRLVLKDEEDKYQLLCANCNWIKKHENNEV